MNELKIFENPAFGRMRTTIIDNEPWFAGKDVAAALGYGDTAQAIRKHVDSDDKGVVEMTTPGGKQNVTVINESGLYSLILSSKLPAAKEFKHWVTADVLPAIRKHGAYMTPEMLERAILNPDVLIRVCQQLKDEQEKSAQLAEMVTEQGEQITELTASNTQMKPKAEYFDLAMSSGATMTATELAASLGLRSAQRLNKLLCSMGIQRLSKCGGYYVLTAKYADKGYAVLNQKAYGSYGMTKQLRFTQKGRKFIYDLLVESGVIEPEIVPSSEQTFPAIAATSTKCTEVVQ